MKKNQSHKNQSHQQTDNSDIVSCVVSGKQALKNEMLKLVVSPDGRVIVDLKDKIKAECCYITPDCKMIEFAFSQGLIAKNFQESEISNNEAEKVINLARKQLEDSLIGWISLANKSGAIVSGSMKVINCLKKDNAVMVLHAAESSHESRRKIIKNSNNDELKIYEIANAEILSKALGKSNVMHTALLQSHFAAEIIREINRLTGFYKKDGL